MIEEQFLNVIKMVCKRLANDDINWVVTGSLGMALLGVIKFYQQFGFRITHNVDGEVYFSLDLPEFFMKPECAM